MLESSHPKSSGLAIAPLLLFVFIFLGTGIWLHLQGVDFAFYQLPAPVAIIPAIILALMLDKHLASNPITLDNSLTTLIQGMGNDKVITMCLIYLLAGAFSSVAQATGGVDVMVNVGLQFVPAPLVIAGLFLVSAVVATAMGTSMGTIGAIAPIAVGIVGNVDIDPAVIAGAVVGGAIFGDNLSLISDTTIASTKTQGAELKDKFYENLIFAIPAALICVAVYAYIGFNNPAQVNATEVNNIWLGLPYLLVIILAIMGMNVFLVLLLGILLSAVTGALLGDYQISLIGKDIYTGFSNMQEIFLLSMLIGGLSELMKRQGGLGYLVDKINAIVHFFSKTPSSATNQIAIASLAFTTNLAVANNTVAIIVTGDTAKELAEEGHISPKRSASLLDVFSCIAQGLVPYGAQALLVAATFSISPLEVVMNVWYCMILAVVSIGVVAFRHSRKENNNAEEI
ncbi:sodium:proton antiporter [Psychrosphaera saromensis]|uniref:Sodium:proton antiporter n=1 Tax=Psychrosphaera saromensis TaxID=716813 RepID=A0A2S7UXU0_9GAMM|nr:Na+/H+ antiporter NhaC family protein [Psychrosphaera saromensis]PQJ54816.1 sodium:proton antiporter [Psychrosphaera saromensis]GHB56885.1 sodium:proton antiporter [Psychrosphaera saromensis]GLQ13943.1 sodium:proton antiporter [Psychrosphaera saromensis]